MSSPYSSTAHSMTAAAGRTSAVLQALLAAFLGVTVLAGVGFAHIEVVHNAVHDARHAAGFPCH